MTRAKFNLIICNDMNKGVKSRFVDEALRIASINSIPHEILPLITDSFKRVGRYPKCEEEDCPNVVIKTKNQKIIIQEDTVKNLMSFLAVVHF